MMTGTPECPGDGVGAPLQVVGPILNRVVGPISEGHGHQPSRWCDPSQRVMVTILEDHGHYPNSWWDSSQRAMMVDQDHQTSRVVGPTYIGWWDPSWWVMGTILVGQGQYPRRWQDTSQ